MRRRSAFAGSKSTALPHVSSKCAAYMMVLAMNVVSDRTAWRGVFRTGHDGQDPASRDGEFESLLERYARLCVEYPVFPVGTDDPVEAAHSEHVSRLSEATIVVAAPAAKGQRRALHRAQGVPLFVRQVPPGDGVHRLRIGGKRPQESRDVGVVITQIAAQKTTPHRPRTAMLT